MGPLAIFCALLFSGRCCLLPWCRMGETPSGSCCHLTTVPLAGGHAVMRLEQPAVVMACKSTSATLSCTANTKVNYIHWYRHQEGKSLERILHLTMDQSVVHWDLVEKAEKVTAIGAKDGYSCTLLVLKLEKSDKGMYYCAFWEYHSPVL